MNNSLKVYLARKNNPYERQQAALDLREKAAERISKRLDPLRRKWFLNLLKSAQDTAPLREDSIADMGLGHPQIRCLLGELGKRLAARGAIVNADDIYWLKAQELDALAISLEQGEALENFSAEVERRKAKWEAMRHIVPPNTLPQKIWISRFYADNEQTSNTIKGFAASAGKVTARACVMLRPEDFDKMRSGDVIVAGITTPPGLRSLRAHLPSSPILADRSVTVPSLRVNTASLLCWRPATAHAASAMVRPSRWMAARGRSN